MHYQRNSQQRYGDSSSPDEKKLLYCYVINARSLKNKLSDLHHFLYSTRADCVCITESWLSNEITDGLLDPNGEYSIFRKDRVGASGGGGVCAMVRKTLGAKQIDILSDDSPTELLCFDVFSASTPYRFFCVI